MKWDTACAMAGLLLLFGCMVFVLSACAQPSSDYWGRLSKGVGDIERKP